jgi:hypothetical protein
LRFGALFDCLNRLSVQYIANEPQAPGLILPRMALVPEVALERRVENLCHGHPATSGRELQALPQFEWDAEIECHKSYSAIRPGLL